MEWSEKTDGEAISHLCSEDLVEVKVLSSGWQLCSSHLQVEPQYLSLGLYYLCYSSRKKWLSWFHFPRHYIKLQEEWECFNESSSMLEQS